MSNKLKFLIKTSLGRKLKSKWFIIINIIIVIAIISIANLDTIISFFGGNFNEKTKIVVIDNTNKVYDIFEKALETNQQYTKDTDGKNSTENISIYNTKNIEVEKSNKTYDEVIKTIKDNKTILIVFDDDAESVISAKLVTNSYMDAIMYQTIASSINASKSSVALLESKIDINDIYKISAPVKIDREFVDKTKTQSGENMDAIMEFVVPVIILPFYMLILFLVQMIGAEVNEEKTTRGMEIIISNVSPTTHLISKIVSSNLFIIIQGLILIVASAIGLFIRNLTTSSFASLASIGIDLSSIGNQLVESGFVSKLIYIIPLTLILLVLSFILYSLLASILASMTTSMEDYQQILTPIILVCLVGFYLSILAPSFEGSIFIKSLSYVPFISVLLCPPLLVIGQIGIIDVIISIIILLGTVYIMIKYGTKIYKVGILNYSTSKLWRKMWKAVRE